MGDMRILFMGTPEFASKSLEYLIKNSYGIAGVVCQPDSPKNRGHKITPPPVKLCLKDLSVPVCQPETLKNCMLQAFLEQIKPDLIVVVAYGRILPSYILEFPKYGCINLHASLLPKYRGAAPIARAIMNGETKTGLSTMYLSRGMDEGDIIFTLETQIGERETAGELTARLATLGAPLLAKTIDAIAAGNAPRISQNHKEATYAPMIQKNESRLDFLLPARRVYNIFRALTPNPGITTLCRGKILKITDMDYYDGSIPAGKNGEAVCVSKNALVVRCGDGSGICILRVAPEGKREMSYADFINGRGVSEGEILGF